MIHAVGDLGAVLRWAGVLTGPAPRFRSLTAPDSLVAEIIQALCVRHGLTPTRVFEDLAAVMFAVSEWRSTTTFSFELATLALSTPTDLDVSLLAPVALAQKMEIPLVTTSAEIAEIAHGFVPSVELLGRP